MLIIPTDILFVRATANNEMTGSLFIQKSVLELLVEP